jgi:hypothetical protein
MRKRAWVGALAAVLAFLTHPVGVMACSVCYGEPDSPVSRGLTLAILALALVVMVVLAGVVGFFVQASRKAELLDAAAAASARIEKS